MPAQAHVYVVDDDSAVRESLQSLLTEVGYQTETYASGVVFLANYQRKEQECLVVDLRMPELTGLEVQRQLQLRGWSVPCIFLSGHGDIPVAVQALNQGAVSFWEKPCNPRELLAMVGQCLARSQQQHGESQSPSPLKHLLERLTVDELAVLRGVIRGLSNRQMAVNLDISVRTIQFRLASLIKKLGVNSRSELFDVVWSAGGFPLESSIPTRI